MVRTFEGPGFGEGVAFLTARHGDTIVAGLR
jgi:hypothetical protein